MRRGPVSQVSFLFATLSVAASHAWVPRVNFVAVLLLLAACASVQRQPHQELMYAAAAECQEKYRSDIERYELDRFGRIVAHYKENRSKQATEPFFPCYDERLREKIQTASSTSPVPPASVRADLNNVPAPVWKRGYEWTYLWESPRGSGTYAWVVNRVETVDGVECYVIRAGSREPFWRVSDLTSAMTTNDGAVEVRNIPPRQSFPWPLALGRVLEQRWTVVRPLERTTSNLHQTWTVEGQERVTVPAGEFSTWKVVVRNNATNSMVWEYWYSPDAKQYVRTRDYFSYGVETRVLTAFKLD